MPRANQHWVEELDFAIEEWTLDGVRLVEVPGRVPSPRAGARSRRSSVTLALACPSVATVKLVPCSKSHVGEGVLR